MMFRVWLTVFGFFIIECRDDPLAKPSTQLLPHGMGSNWNPLPREMADNEEDVADNWEDADTEVRIRELSWA